MTQVAEMEMGGGAGSERFLEGELAGFGGGLAYGRDSLWEILRHTAGRLKRWMAFWVCFSGGCES